jgi:hypothetical protein
MRTGRYLAIIITLFLFLNSCRKIEHLSPVPRIEYTSFEIFDSTDILGNSLKAGRLKFYFEDGDGDLGLEDPGTSKIESSDLFFTLYRKAGGVMAPAPANDPLKPGSYRIPYMERTGINRILIGTISVTFLYDPIRQSDTLRYDFYLKDRAGNQSNLESTSEIAVYYNNIYKKL